MNVGTQIILPMNEADFNNQMGKISLTLTIAYAIMHQEGAIVVGMLSQVSLLRNSSQMWWWDVIAMLLLNLSLIIIIFDVRKIKEIEN